MADPSTSPSLVAALASAGALLIRELVDQLKVQYRKSKNGDRRKANGHATDDATLRALITSEAEATRSALKAHADQDEANFNTVIKEIAIMRQRYHDDAGTLSAVVAKVELLIANKIKH